MDALSLKDYQTIAPEFGPDVSSVFDYAHSVATHDVAGGTGPQSVRHQLTQARRLLNI